MILVIRIKTFSVQTPNLGAVHIGRSQRRKHIIDTQGVMQTQFDGNNICARLILRIVRRTKYWSYDFISLLKSPEMHPDIASSARIERVKSSGRAVVGIDVEASIIGVFHQPYPSSQGIFHVIFMAYA